MAEKKVTIAQVVEFFRNSDTVGLTHVAEEPTGEVLPADENGVETPVYATFIYEVHPGRYLSKERVSTDEIEKKIQEKERELAELRTKKALIE